MVLLQFIYVLHPWKPRAFAKRTKEDFDVYVISAISCILYCFILLLSFNKNGKSIARLTTPVLNKQELLDDLVGIVPQDQAMDANAISEERLSEQ